MNKVYEDYLERLEASDEFQEFLQVERDSLEDLERRADQGEAEALYLLRRFDEAANAGHAISQFHMAKECIKKTDLQQSKIWLELASKNGILSARPALEWVLNQLKGKQEH